MDHYESLSCTLGGEIADEANIRGMSPLAELLESSYFPGIPLTQSVFVFDQIISQRHEQVIPSLYPYAGRARKKQIRGISLWGILCLLFRD